MPSALSTSDSVGVAEKPMFARLDEARSLTVNQLKIIAAAIAGDMLEFFDYFLIAFVLAFIIAPWHLTGGQSAIILMSSGLGAVLGSAIWGRLADLFGRRSVFMLTILNFSIASGLLYFTPDNGWIYLSVLRFFVGFGVGGLYCVDLPLVQEFVPARMRGLISGLVTAFVPLGIMFAASIAAFFSNAIGWRGLFLLGLLPAAFTLVVRVWVPESPRWLLAQGRSEDARRSIAWALKVSPASLNLPDEEIKQPHVRWRELFSYPRSVASSWIASITVQTAGHGIAMWAPALFVLQLGVTPAQAAHLYIWVTAAVIVGRIVFAMLSEIIGRRLSGALSGFGAAIAIFLAGVLHNAMLGSVSVLWILIILAGFFLDGGGAVLGPYMAEVWPTRLRTTGMGSAYGFGGLGKILGPLALALIVGTSDVMNPKATIQAIGPAFFLFAACAALSGCAYLFLGLETKGASLTALDARLEKQPGGEIARVTGG